VTIDCVWLNTECFTDSHRQSEDKICCLLQGFAVLTITPKHATSTWCGTPQHI
jgi:hypothetical protein